MLKKISILVLILTIFISAIFAESNSLFGEYSKFRYESKVGYSSQTFSIRIFPNTETRGVDINQKTISIDELIKYDSGNGFDYVLSGGARFPFKASFNIYNIGDDQPLTSSSFQNSLNLFFGIEKEFDFSNNLSLNLAFGVDTLYLFEDESLYYYPLEADKEAKISTYGFGGSLKVNYIILNNMKINIGINFIYNPLVFGETINVIREMSNTQSVKYYGIFYSINPTIGISYSL